MTLCLRLKGELVNISLSLLSLTSEFSLRCRILVTWRLPRAKLCHCCGKTRKNGGRCAMLAAVMVLYRWSISTRWDVTLLLKCSVNYTACSDFPNVVAKCHIFGGVHPGGYDPKIELGWDICTMHLPYPQVSSSCVYSFGSYRVDKHTHTQTNKQIPLKTSNVLRYATMLSKYELDWMSRLWWNALYL